MIPLQRIGRSEAGKRIWDAGQRYLDSLNEQARKRAEQAREREAKRLQEAEARAAELWGVDLARMGNWRGHLATIIEEVAEKHKLNARDLRGSSRSQSVVRARQEAMYRCVSETGRSTIEIGRALGNKDHTTVIHGVRHHALLHYLKLPRGMRWPHEVEAFRLKDKVPA